MTFFRTNSCFKHLQNVCCSKKRTFSEFMMVPKNLALYGDEASPPVRFALMTASLLNIDLQFHHIDLFKAENRTEFYKKINPLQKVPALKVHEGIICDSHAIALYFCRSKDNQKLYPQDIMLRTKIDEWLYFDAGILFPLDSAIFTEFFSGKGLLDEVKVNNWYSTMDYLEQKLNNQKWLTGDKLRLCDICCGATISSLEILVPLSEGHGNVKEWLSHLESLPCFKINKRGLERLRSFVEMIKQTK